MSRVEAGGSPMPLALAAASTWSAFAASVLGILLLVAASQPLEAAEQPVAYEGATVIDGTGQAPIEDAVLVLRGSRIEQVGRRGDVSVPQDAERIDASGRWIIPGLIDAHVHFFQSGGLYTRPDVIDLRWARPYDEEIRRIKASLPETFARYVASGVTAAVDVGGPMWNFEVRARAGELDLAPRVAVAGPLLGTYVPPEQRIDDPPIIGIETPGQARALVRRQLAHDSDLIKIWFVYPGDDLEPDLEWVRAAIDEAHAADAPVVAHATQQRVARAMVEAGVDVLAHSIDDQPIDDPMLDLMRERDVIYTTTLIVGRRYRAVFGRFLELTPIERRGGDPAIIESLSDLERLPQDRLPEWIGRTRPQPLDPVVANNLVRIQEAGITVAAGSDAGNIGTLHGPSLHRELQLMVEAGLTPMQVLVAATAGGAAVMDRAAELGTLEPGKLADFVILDADPLEDIANTQAIHRVVKGGRVFDPAAILRSLKD